MLSGAASLSVSLDDKQPDELVDDAGAASSDGAPTKTKTKTKTKKAPNAEPGDPIDPEEPIDPGSDAATPDPELPDAETDSGAPATPTPTTQSFGPKNIAEDERHPYGPFVAKGGTSFEAKTTGSGDVDLYTSWDSPTTFGNANCESDGADSSERCRRTVPAGGAKVYVMVFGWDRNSSYTLTVTFTPDP